ncbi:DUF4229 domain-containing protein [Agrococcus sp. 1P02AA]|uniref:DUF4229 domain-containing protein n=1 Tax=Agrococcus sp. 1P02AA TaxID=3132259 RepID=UPI0039A56614
MAPSLRYLVVRALLFVVPFAVLMIARVPWVLSLVVAIAFAFAASIVFFGRLRAEAAADLQRMRDGRRREDAAPDDGDVEDAMLHGDARRPGEQAADDDDARDDDGSAPSASDRP